MWLEIIKFLIYSFFIVLISKYILVRILRKLAENLNLSAKVVGNIGGIATSIPELLTVYFSAITGLIETGLYNILSSNIINFIQYVLSICINKNQKIIKNKAIFTDLILVILTIIIPTVMLMLKMEPSIYIVPMFIFLFCLFYFINFTTHKLYKKKNNIKTDIEKEGKKVAVKLRISVVYSSFLIITGVSLYIVGNALSNSLENLANYFNVSQIILGIILGAITSIPEVITFLEAQRHHRKQENEELGVIEATNNLLTSNLLNLFIIQTIGIMVYNIFYTI